MTRMTIALSSAITAFALFSAPAIAVDNPATMAGATVVTADQAKALHDKGVLFVDVRSKNEFAEAHIKGAKAVPYKEKSTKVADFDGSADSFDLSQLPADKATAMVFYCNGIDCWKSYKAGTTAVKGGYTQVNWLRGGIPEWKAKGFPIQ